MQQGTVPSIDQAGLVDSYPSTSLLANAITAVDSWTQTCSESEIISSALSPLHNFLLSTGMSEDRLPTAESFTYTWIVILISITIYALRTRRRKRLKRELRDAQEKVRYLQEKLYRSISTTEKEVRIFIDGAFDCTHYGHMNAFRLGRSLGTTLVVGVNSDESITECKGVPLMNDQERLTMVSGCKFVDEVIPGVPYIMNRDYLDYVIEKYNIDYVVHGDDPCIVDGKDVYATAKQAGKFRTIPRTEGVSTTDIVGRMLLMTKEHHFHNNGDNAVATTGPIEVLGNQSKFLTTSRMLQLFSAGVQAPTKDMRVVYLDGAFDLFHPGHVVMLKTARERGDYLLVGIHSDAAVNRYQGMNLPLMNLHERVLSVLGCRYVSDVLIDAPYEITPEMIKSLNITEVVRGATPEDQDEDVRYKYAKEAGIFTVIKRPSDFSIGRIVGRIQTNQEAFQAKFKRKMQAESQFYQEKYAPK